MVKINISLPMAVILFFVLFFSMQSCKQNTVRRIKLAAFDSTQTNSGDINAHTIKVADIQQQNIAVLAFSNETGDNANDWLQRGITDMLITKLSQSAFLNVIPIQRITEVSTRIDKEQKHMDNLARAYLIGREVLAEMAVTGRFYMSEEGIKIDVQLLDVVSERIIDESTSSGSQLESIFSMVDVLSDRLFENLRNKKINTVEISQMTHSLEAFRYYSQALVDIEKFLHSEAEQCLKKALAEDSTFASALLRMAEVKMVLGEKKSAAYYLDLSQKHADKLGEADKYYIKVFQAMLSRDYGNLIPTLEEGVAKLPGNVDLRLELARIYKGFGLQDRALEQYDIILDLDPQQKMALNELGYLYARRGDFKTALNYIEKYMEVAPDEPNPYDSKGELLMMAGELEQADNQMHLALEKWPDFYHSAYRLSELYAEYGQFDNAFKYLAKARQFSIKSNLTNFFIVREAMLLWKANRIVEARKLLEKAVQKNQGEPLLVYHLSELYRFLGDTTKMVQVQENYADYLYENKSGILPESEDIFYLYVLNSQLPPERYIPWFQQVIPKMQDNQNKILASYILCLLYARSGDYARAEKTIRGIKDPFNIIFSNASQFNWAENWRYINELARILPRDKNDKNPLMEKLGLVCGQNACEEVKLGRQLARLGTENIHRSDNKFESEYRLMGIPDEQLWSLSGPYKAWDRSGFLTQYPPESESENEKIKWEISRDSQIDGYVNLKETLGDGYWSVGYALIYVQSPVERKVQIRLGCDEAYKLWLNDDLILKRYVREGAILDRDIVTVVFHQGYNKLFLKSLNTSFEWGFYFRITDDQGQGFKDISFHTPDDVKGVIARK